MAICLCTDTDRPGAKCKWKGYLNCNHSTAL